MKLAMVLLRMKKITLLSVFFCSSVFSQTDTLSLDKVEISSGRIPQLYTETSRILKIITREEIALMPVFDIQDILEFIPGTDIRQRGINGAQADVSLRAGSFEQTLILLNGIPVNDPQTGHHNLDLPVDIEQIDRIEILEGSGTKLYGTNAFSGAINIITGESTKPEIKVSLSGGEYGYYSGAVSGGFKTGKFNNYLAASGKNCDGYRVNTDLKNYQAFFQSQYKVGHGKINLQAGYMDKAFGANSFYTAKYPDQFEQTHTEFVSLSGNWATSFRIRPAIYWRRHHDRFELFREDSPAWDNKPVWYSNHNYHMTDILGAELNSTIYSSLGKTSAGMSFKYEQIFSNVLGELMTDTVYAPFEKSGFFTKTDSRELLSAFIDHNISHGRLTASAGVLMNYSDAFGTGFYPGIDIAYKLSESANIFASANRSLRLPTYTDLYYQGPTNTGNPKLIPEESWNIESGLKFRKKQTYAHICGYYRLGYNLIDWIKYEGDTKWQSENLTSMETTGIQASISILPKKSFIKKTELNIDWAEIKKEEQEFISYYLLDYIRTKITISVDHIIWRQFGASWLAVYQDRAGTYSDPLTNDEKNYNDYIVLNGRVYWKMKNLLTLYINVSNITDTEYRDFGAIPMPGRWLTGGIKLNINYQKK